MMPALLGFVLGSAVQLQQAALYDWHVYAGWLVTAIGVLAWTAYRPRRCAWRPMLVLVACAVAGFCLTGWRAAAFQSHGLAPALEGRDMVVTGVVAAMPQVNEAGTRFRFQVEQARQAATPVQLPPTIYLGWYTNIGVSAGDETPDPQRQPSALSAGERWQITVRLKAPHGNRNPHGFDYELWLWEQGLQATGYVRAGKGDVPARLLGQNNLAR